MPGVPNVVPTPRHVTFTSPGSVVMFDPRSRGGGGGGCDTDPVPQEGVAAWNRALPLSTRADPQSVPERVSVVLVEETTERSARRLTSVPADEDRGTIAGAVSPTGVAGVGLPMIAGTTLPIDVAKQVAENDASLADAGILFLADSDGTLSPTDPDGILFPVVPAKILFPADPVGTLSLSDHAGILFSAVPARILTKP